MTIPCIEPDWPAPPNVRAVSTTRVGGVSTVPFESFNLGAHVGDAPAAVAANRAALATRIDVPRVQWLEQVHDTAVVEAGAGDAPQADACWTAAAGMACAVMTADCLPVLFCDRSGTSVAAAHAGWRGLCAGVLESTVHAMPANPADLLAWMGPAIGPGAFEVGPEVREAFLARDAGAASCFTASRGRSGAYMANIYALARRRLADMGVDAVYGGDFCTVTDRDRFFSYRRDGQTGRMATLVWLSG